MMSRQMKNLLTSHTRRLAHLGLLLLAVCALGADCAWSPFGQHQAHSTFAARRAADDSRPLVRVASGGQRLAHADSQESAVVMGKFRAPAPERIQRARVPKSSRFASQTMSASYQVADSSSPDKIVHGIQGGSVSKQQQTVGAKIQVSDEGLNYPPSKLSADIYGNVAEIVTAPPGAVDSDFLWPNSRRFSASRP